MTQTQIQRFVAHISSHEGQAFALLDTARGYRVHEAVRWSARPHQCLYRGKMPVELERAAPYVVELGGDHNFTRRILGEGWGQNWGLFAVAPVGIELRHVLQHFRSLLRARLEDGSTLVFRYYDPRVLRVYLPTCTRYELNTFFGPLLKIIVEDEGGGNPLTFQRHRGDLETLKVDLSTP